MFEGRSEEVVRDISNVKQEIISYRKIIKPQRPPCACSSAAIERFLPEQLELYFDDLVDASERDLGRARQLQGGQSRRSSRRTSRCSRTGSTTCCGS